jgi:uncharacterized protein (DUF362 family)
MDQRDARAALVAVVETGDDVPAAVGRAMEAAHWRDFVPEGASIALKPNLGWDLFLPGAVTSPLVVEGVVRKLKERASSITLVEADQVLVNCEKAIRQTRMDEICARHGLEWVNLSRSPFRNVPVPRPLQIASLDLPEILTRSVLVTVPVMKTHNKTVLSGAIKNQWGCLPKFRHNYHPVVNEVLRDLSTVLRPAFSVLDATVALEGNGPKSGRPRVCNLVLAGGDPVAVDTVSAQIMALDRFRIRHLELCAEAGVGTHEPARIRTVDGNGAERTELPRFHFTPARHNAVSWVETALRSTVARRLIFESPLLQPFCWGARLWYFVWYYLGKGTRLRDQAIRESPYGDQWRRTEAPR